MTIYLAEGLTAGAAEPEDDERITTRFVGLTEAKQMALHGRIEDAKTIAGILWLSQTLTSTSTSTSGATSRRKR
jgi:ADP-ribose pyrophosphatase